MSMRTNALSDGAGLLVAVAMYHRAPDDAIRVAAIVAAALFWAALAARYWERYIGPTMRRE